MKDPKIIGLSYTASELLFGKIEAAEVYHEISHFLVATVLRKSMPDWGLGTGPGGDGYEVRSYDRRDMEEQHASILGIHLMWRTGLRKEARETYRYHSWTDGGFRVALVRLRKAIALVKARNPGRVDIEEPHIARRYQYLAANP